MYKPITIVVSGQGRRTSSRGNRRYVSILKDIEVRYDSNLREPAETTKEVPIDERGFGEDIIIKAYYELVEYIRELVHARFSE